MFDTNIVPDFTFLKIPNTNSWVINAPKRSTRPHLARKGCVFCPGNEEEGDTTVFKIEEERGGKKWQIRVKKNKFPFVPIHEVVILTPDHIKSLCEASVEQFRLGVESFVSRFNTHKKSGSVVIFGNSGHDAGESVGHPHAQIAVVQDTKEVIVPKLEKDVKYWGEHFKVGEFEILCPPYSQWPDEVWIVPLERNKTFGEVSYEEIQSLSFVWHRLLSILNLRHSGKFPHNFYIYPFKDWYVRIIPRDKILGGFEMATGIYVNTGKPSDTMKFIKDHFATVEKSKIKKHRALHRKGV